MEGKKIIGWVIILILILGAIYGVIKLKNRGLDILDSGEIENNQNQIQEIDDNANDEIKYFNIDGVKKVGDVEFSNIKIGLINDSKCEFTADIKNTSKEFVKGTKVSIKVKDESGEIKGSFGGVITDLAGLEPNRFKTYVLSNITYAKDVDIEVVNE